MLDLIYEATHVKVDNQTERMHGLKADFDDDDDSNWFVFAQFNLMHLL